MMNVSNARNSSPLVLTFSLNIILHIHLKYYVQTLTGEMVESLHWYRTKPLTQNALTVVRK